MSNRSYRKGRFAKAKRRVGLPIALVVFLDALLCGVIMLTFAFFHHVLPAMISEYERQQALLNATEPVVTVAPTEDTAPTETTPDVPDETDVPVQTEEPTEAPTEPITPADGSDGKGNSALPLVAGGAVVIGAIAGALAYIFKKKKK